jgi:autotransporter-associated beta strand protein
MKKLTRNSHPAPLPRALITLALALFGLAGAFQPAHAQLITYQWLGGGNNGNWTNTNNWAGGLAPISSDSTSIEFSGDTTITTSENIAGTFLLNNLTFDSSAGAFVLNNGTFEFAIDPASSPYPEYDPSITQNSSSNITINNNLSLNDDLTFNGTGTGTVTLSHTISGNGGLIVAGNYTVNLIGPGNYQGDTTVQSGTLTIGSGGNLFALGSTVTVDDGAMLNVNANGGINNGSNGQLEVSDGSAGTATANFAGNVTTGLIDIADGSGTGVVNQSGGQLIGTTLNIGGGTSSGTYNQNGGKVLLNGLNLGSLGWDLLNNGGPPPITSTATYNLNGGKLTVGVIQTQSINTASTFYFNGGTLIASGNNSTFMQDLTHAYVSANGGTIDNGGYAITIGQALLTDPALDGNQDGGLTFQGSGTLTLTGVSTYIGNTLISSGSTLTLATGGSLTDTYITVADGATLNLSGGSINDGASDQLDVSDGSTGATATVNLSSGAVSVNQVSLASPSDGVAVFNQTGGSLTATSLTIGNGSGSGQYNQTGGTATIGSVVLGSFGFSLSGIIPTPDTYNLDGGTLIAGSIGSPSSRTTLFYFNGGTLQASGDNATFMQGLTNAYVSAGGGTIDNGGYAITIGQALLTDPALDGGEDGGMTFQGSGTTTLTGASTYIGNTLISSGSTLTLTTGGSLTDTAITVANGATLNLSGGNINSNTSSSFLQVGDGSTGATSTVNLSSGTLTTTDTTFANQTGSTAVFNQTGGIHNIKDKLSLGYYQGASGTYNLSNGQVSALVLNVVGAGTGTFNQTGGSVTVDAVIFGTESFFSLGGGNPGVGVYNLSGGTLTTGEIDDENSATAKFYFNGGTLIASGDNANFMQGLTHAYVSAGGGTINNDGYDITIGQALQTDPALDGNQDGGLTFQGSGTLTLGSAGTYTGGTTVIGGTLDIAADNAAGTGDITLNNAELIGSAEIANDINFVGSEGTVAGVTGSTLTLDGALSFTGNGPTTLNIGDAVNTGTVALTSDLDIAANTVQIAANATLDNQASFELGGGQIKGSGTLTNDGTISGNGTISSAFVNEDDGVVAVYSPGTLKITDAFTNSGLVQVLSAGAILSGGAITNDGQVEGFGNIKSNVANDTGTISALGGTLDFTGSVTNGSDGTISASAGNEVLVAQGLATNAGLISLAGGQFNNNNHALDNTGSITGYGVFTTGAGGLSTSGTVDFSGGTATIDGTVGVTGGTVDIYNTANFNGAVTISGGTVTTHSATAVFAKGLTVSGGQFFSDPSPVEITDLTIGPAGSVGGASGALYQVSGNVNNQSAQNQLGTSTVEFVASGDTGNNAHSLTWSANTGLTDIGNLTIDSGQTVQTQNTEAGDIGTLQVNQLQLTFVLNASQETAGSLLSFSLLKQDVDDVFTGGNLLIYYNSLDSANAYLQDQTISYGDGGELIGEAIAAPEPSAWIMLAAGLLLLLGRSVALRQRRR